MSSKSTAAISMDDTPVLKERAPSSGSSRAPRIIFLIAILIILNAIYNQSVSSRYAYNEMLKLGEKFPPFKLELVGGGQITDKDVKGKPTAYFFFAEWCPCSHYTADWVKRSREDGRYAGINMVGVGIQDSPGDLEKFAKRYQFDFPVSHKGGDAMAKEIGVKVTPTTIFTDSEGVVRSIFVGKVEKYKQLTDGLDAIIPAASQPVSG